MDHGHMTHSSMVVDGHDKILEENFNFWEQETMKRNLITVFGTWGAIMGNGVHATYIDVSGFWHGL